MTPADIIKGWRSNSLNSRGESGTLKRDNLTTATDHRSALEANFARHRLPEWSLQRNNAIGTGDVALAALPETQRGAGQASFLGHRKAIESALAVDGDVMILEDDVLFGAHLVPRAPSRVATVRPEAVQPVETPDLRFLPWY